MVTMLKSYGKNKIEVKDCVVERLENVIYILKAIYIYLMKTSKKLLKNN